MDESKNVNQSSVDKHEENQLKVLECIKRVRTELTAKYVAYFTDHSQFINDVYSAPRAVSYSTGNDFGGANALILNFATLENQYKDPRWVSDYSMKLNNLVLTKDAKPVFLTGKSKNGNLLYYKVYNVEQVQGIEPMQPKLPTDYQREAELRKIIARSGVKVVNDMPPSSKGFYEETKDVVHLGLEKSYPTRTDYYLNIVEPLMHRVMAKNPKTFSNGSESEFDVSVRKLRASLAMMELRQRYGLKPDYDLDQSRLAFESSFIKEIDHDRNLVPYIAVSAARITDRLLEKDKSNQVEKDDVKSKPAQNEISKDSKADDVSVKKEASEPKVKQAKPKKSLALKRKAKDDRGLEHERTM